MNRISHFLVVYIIYFISLFYYLYFVNDLLHLNENNTEVKCWSFLLPVQYADLIQMSLGTSDIFGNQLRLKRPRLCEKSFYQSFSHGRITRFLWAHISESSCLKTKISPSNFVRAHTCSWGQKGTLKYWFLWDLENEIIKTNWLYVFLLVLQLLSFIIKDYD